MKLAWRVIKVFGWDVTLPEIAIQVQPLCPKIAAKLQAHKAEMAGCGKCHKLYVGRYPLSLISHLVDQHGVDSFVAIQIIEDLGRKTLAQRAARREAAITAAD
jgi:hypothetical protein